MEAATVVKGVIIAAKQYLNHKTDNNSTYFLRQLEILIGVTTKSSLKFFNPKKLHPIECLTAIIDILNSPQDTQVFILEQCLQLLHNLVADSEIRISLHQSFHITPVLAGILKACGTKGDNLTLQCISLTQKVTYGQRLNFEERYVEELLTFILKQIDGPVHELTMPCLGLLVNMCQDNFSVQSYLKNQENRKALYKTLFSYFSQNDLTIITLSLSVITSLGLHEDLGERLFNARNINQTFQTIFNILIKGDSGVTRRYAVDLFKDLLKYPKIHKFLAKFDRLSSCLDSILKLISSSTSESVVKVFELLLIFCRVEGVRTMVCKCVQASTFLQGRQDIQALLQSPISDVQEPLIAVVHWASQSVENYDQAPLLALDFLTEFYEELIYSNTRLQYSSHADLILPMTQTTLQTKYEGTDALVKTKCQKIVKVLHLLIVLCGEDDIKKKLLKLVNMDMCSHHLEYQLNHNRITVQAHRSENSPEEDWSEEGVDIVLFFMELMEKLRRSLPELDALFTSILQDNRMVPFLSSGLCNSMRERVQTTLQLVTLGANIDSFPTVLLGDAMATQNKIAEADKAAVAQTAMACVTSRDHSHQNNKENIHKFNHTNVLHSSSMANTNNSVYDHEASINSIIDRMQTGLEVKDIRSSEIIDLYEHKLQSLQTKENQLQDLLEAKTMSLTQADRMIAQYRSRRAQTEAEAHKLRTMLQDSEKQQETSRVQLEDISIRKDHLQNELDLAQQENQKLEQVVDEHKQLTEAYNYLNDRHEASEKAALGLKQELKTLTEMHEMLQKHNESLKHQHDVASEQLQKLDEERKHMSKQLKEKETKLTDITKTHKKVEKEFKAVEKERDTLEDTIDKLRINLEKTEQAKKQLQQENKSLDIVCRKFEADLAAKTQELKDLKSNLDKHAQLTALIHSLSSGKSEDQSK